MNHTLRLLSCFALAIAAFAAAPCHAGLVLKAPTLDVAPGSAGSFDLILENMNVTGGDSFTISADVLEIELVGPAGVQFTGVSILTTLPYLFTSPGVDNGGGPFSFDSFPNTVFVASDAEFGAPGFATIAPGQSYAVASISYFVDTSATGRDEWTLVFASGTALFDADGESAAFELINGALRVVPEPSTALMMASGLVAAFALRSRRVRLA